MKKIVLALSLAVFLVSGCSSTAALEAAPSPSDAPKTVTPTTTPVPGPINPPTSQQAGTLEHLLYDIYPDTDAEPVLEFQWGPPDLKLSQVISIVPYGIWKGPPGKRYEPSVSIQLFTATAHDPVIALAGGTVVEMSNAKDCITVRYGRNYGITYFHVVDFPPSIRVGMKIEAGTLLGYTAGRDGMGWWEIEVAVKRYNLFRTVSPLVYFSANSREKLQTLLYVAQWGFSDSTRSWMVTDGDAWTKYLPTPGWRTEPIRVGYALDLIQETEEDFLTVQNLTWVLSNPVNPPEPEVLGPAPSCH